jgi:HK97 gp10 family phage protein
MATVVWEGLNAWITMVVDMKQTTPEKVKSIMSEIGTSSKEIMDANTPVDTGVLKAGNTLEQTDNEFTLSNSVMYAKFQEFGTRYMPAQPFLTPAVEFGAKEMEEKLPKALEIG